MLQKTMKYLTVRVGDQWCGLDVNHIIEVFHLMAFKAVPTERADVLGFITVRDEVMPLIDMRRRFGLGDIQYHLETPIVAMREPSGPIALLFDNTHQVEDIDAGQVTGLQEDFPDIRAVAKVGERLVLLLQTDLISQAIHAQTAQ